MHKVDLYLNCLGTECAHEGGDGGFFFNCPLIWLPARKGCTRGYLARTVTAYS